MNEASPVRRFFGGALIAVGFLLMALCGSCGAIFLLGFLYSGFTSPNSGDLGLAIMPLVLGGVPTAIGLGLFIAGRSLRNPSGPPGRPPP